MISRLLSACLSLVLSFVSLPLLAAPQRLFVDQRGLDSWSGTTARPNPSRHQGPFATLGTALAKAREIHASQPSEPVVIQLSNGRHELHEPLRLSADDSFVQIVGVSGRNPTVLSGGSKITRWTAVAGEPGLWEAHIPDVADGHWYFHQLFVNGERAQRARTPNTGFFQATAPLSTNSPIALTFKPGDIQPAWASDPDARLIVLMKWTDLHLPIRAVDPTAHLARLAGGPRDYWMDEPDARYWIENTADSLDAPGEWHLDRRTGKLRYLAPRGIQPNQAEIIAPRLTHLVEIRGSAARPVRGIEFRNITFADADYVMPTNGLISPQAAIVIPGTFRASHATDCRLAHCRFTDLGGYGVELGRGCQRWTIEDSRFDSLGAGGIRFGETGDRSPSPADANHTHIFADNVLNRLGRIFAPAVGILVLQSGTNRIVHNHVQDLYYTGISVGWNWGYNDSPCRSHEIAYNLVEKIGQARLSDMGGIYTLGPQPGTHIHHNLFRDVDSYRYGGWGLYTDEGSTGILLEDNVVYRCKDAGFHQHYGRDNVVRNNLLAFNRNHQVMRTRSEEHRSFWFTHNVVIHDAGTLLGSSWSGSTNQFWMNSNTYWDTRLGSNPDAYRFLKQSWSDWRARGQDPDSIIADPLLRNPDRPELGLKPNSPAFNSGFKPIDLRTLGPRTPHPGL